MVYLHWQLTVDDTHNNNQPSERKTMYMITVETEINGRWFTDHAETQYKCDLEEAKKLAFELREPGVEVTIYKELTTDEWNDKECPVCKDGACETRSYRCGK